jgi:MoaA/NifB/PqqE/SkfB family radical SAM enzyme
MSSAPVETIKYGFQSEQARTFPQIIVLENTTVCNLRCIHCPQGQGYPEREDYHPVFLEWDLYKKAIDEISQYPINHLRFSPAGEALIHPQFLDQVAYAKAKGIAPLNLTTNGLTLDNPAIENGKKLPGKTILDRLLDHGIDIIDISLDGHTRNTYEKVRRWSSFHRVWSNIHRILYLREKQKAPTKLMLSFIVQPESEGEVDDFVKYWTPLVDRVIVRGYLENLGLTPHKQGTLVDKLTSQSVERWPCPQFWKRITIAPDGTIRFCVTDWLDKSALGHLRTHSIKQIWDSAEYERLRGCHLGGRYAEAHPICGPCTDWMGMRWDWGFENAINAVLGKKGTLDSAPPLLQLGRPNDSGRPATPS